MNVKEYYMQSKPGGSDSLLFCTDVNDCRGEKVVRIYLEFQKRNHRPQVLVWAHFCINALTWML